MNKYPLVAGLILAAATFSPAAMAAPVSAPPSQSATLLPLVQKAQWGRDHDWRHRRWHHRRWSYCRAWRHTCARRWGWGGWRYNRCLARHGC